MWLRPSLIWSPLTMIESPASGPETQPTVPLSCLKEGEWGYWHASNLCCEDCELLNAMGMTDRCSIRVCQSGEPCIVQVDSTRLGLSAALARNILVCPATPRA